MQSSFCLTLFNLLSFITTLKIELLGFDVTEQFCRRTGIPNTKFKRALQACSDG